MSAAEKLGGCSSTKWQGPARVELLPQAGEVPRLRADLDIALEAPARAEHGQGLRHHLLLLLEQRRHGVPQVGEERLDALQLLLDIAIDGLLVAMPLASVVDQVMEAVFRNGAKDGLQEPVEGVRQADVGEDPVELARMLDRRLGLGAVEPGTVVLVPEHVGEAEVGIDLPLQREQVPGARIGAMELLDGRMRLVRQVVGAADRERRVDQLAGPDADPALRVLARALLVIQDEGEGLARRPAEHRLGVGHRMADRDVERIDPVPAQDLLHPRHEVVELLDRHEVLLQHVGAVHPARRLELGDVVAGLVVAPVHLLAEIEQRVDELLAPLLAERRLRDRPEEVLVQRIGARLRLQPGRGRRPVLGLDPGDRAHRLVVRRVQVGVVKHRFRIVAHRVAEMRPVLGERHHRVGRA